MFGTTSSIGYTDRDTLDDLDPDIALRFTFLELEREDVEETLKRVQLNRKIAFDKRAKPQTFEPGDTVLIHDSALGSNKESKFKLSTRWYGPFIIHERHHNSYTVKTLAGRIAAGRIHAIRLKKFVLNPDLNFSRQQLQEVEKLAGDVDCDDPTTDDDKLGEWDLRDIPGNTASNSESVTSHNVNPNPPNLEHHLELDSVDIKDDITIPIAQRRTKRRAVKHHRIVELRPPEDVTEDESLEGLRRIFGG